MEKTITLKEFLENKKLQNIVIDYDINVEDFHDKPIDEQKKLLTDYYYQYLINNFDAIKEEYNLN